MALGPEWQDPLTIRFQRAYTPWFRAVGNSKILQNLVRELTASLCFQFVNRFGVINFFGFKYHGLGLFLNFQPLRSSFPFFLTLSSFFGSPLWCHCWSMDRQWIWFFCLSKGKILSFSSSVDLPFQTDTQLVLEWLASRFPCRLCGTFLCLTRVRFAKVLMNVVYARRVS